VESTVKPVIDPGIDQIVIRTWLHGRPDNTALGYRRDAGQMLAAIGKPLGDIELGDLQGWADRLARLAPATRRRKLAAAKSLLRYAAEMGAIGSNPAARVRLGSAAAVAGERSLTDEQVRRLIGAEPDDRRRALLRLLYVGALRASEACALRWRDLTARPGGGGEASIRGKGNKHRLIVVPKSLWRDLAALNSTPEPDDPVIPGRDGGKTNRSAVHRAVKRAARRVGLPLVSAHWLRHAHVSHALDRGAPVHLVQQTVGHADLRTTSRYSHVRPGASSSTYLTD
jgi:integrase/recombinase XerC